MNEVGNLPSISVARARRDAASIRTGCPSSSSARASVATNVCESAGQVRQHHHLDVPWTAIAKVGRGRVHLRLPHGLTATFRVRPGCSRLESPRSRRLSARPRLSKIVLHFMRYSHPCQDMRLSGLRLGLAAATLATLLTLILAGSARANTTSSATGWSKGSLELPDISTMGSVGVEALRIPLDWSVVESRGRRGTGAMPPTTGRATTTSSARPRAKVQVAPFIVGSPHYAASIRTRAPDTGHPRSRTTSASCGPRSSGTAAAARTWTTIRAPAPSPTGRCGTRST